jgi:hypothetical protein
MIKRAVPIAVLAVPSGVRESIERALLIFNERWFVQRNLGDFHGNDNCQAEKNKAAKVKLSRL